MQEAIFQSVGQALHVSYLIMSVEARQKNAFREVLMRIIESVELPSARLKAWYKELQGSRGTGTVNFEGLDPYEVRAQCAMVTQAVNDHLPGPERDIIWAKYGFQKERGDGMQGLVQYVRPQLPISDSIAIGALLYCYFHPNFRNRGLSYQDINKERGIHVKTLKRCVPIIDNTVRILESMAVERLNPMFRRDGLVALD